MASSIVSIAQMVLSLSNDLKYHLELRIFSEGVFSPKLTLYDANS